MLDDEVDLEAEAASRSEASESTGAEPPRKPIKQHWAWRVLGPGLLVLPFLEVLVTIQLTRWLGGGAAFAIYAVPALLGLALLGWRYRPMRAAMELAFRNVNERPVTAERSVAMWDSSIYFGTAVLWLVPGVISHLIALYLTLRPPKVPHA